MQLERPVSLRSPHFILSSRDEAKTPTAQSFHNTTHTLTNTHHSNPLQTQTKPRRHHHPNRGLQRRNRNLQEREIQRLGRRRPRQDPPLMAALFLRDPGFDLCDRQQRPRTHRRSQARITSNHSGSGNEGGTAVGVRQQAGYTRGDDADGGDGEVEVGAVEGEDVVCCAELCDEWGGLV